MISRKKLYEKKDSTYKKIFIDHIMSLMKAVKKEDEEKLNKILDKNFPKRDGKAVAREEMESLSVDQVTNFYDALRKIAKGKKENYIRESDNITFQWDNLNNHYLVKGTYNGEDIDAFLVPNRNDNKIGVAFPANVKFNEELEQLIKNKAYTNQLVMRRLGLRNESRKINENDPRNIEVGTKVYYNYEPFKHNTLYTIINIKDDKATLAMTKDNNIKKFNVPLSSLKFVFAKKESRKITEAKNYEKMSDEQLKRELSSHNIPSDKMSRRQMISDLEMLDMESGKMQKSNQYYNLKDFSARKWKELGSKITEAKSDIKDIKPKNPGILELKDGAFKDWNIEKLVKHVVDVAKDKGKAKVSKALQNLIRWNKNENPAMSKKAQSVFDKYSKEMDKLEESRKINEGYYESKKHIKRNSRY